MKTYFRIIFKHLYNNLEGESAYFFHEKYFLSTGQLASFIKEASDNNLIVFNEGRLIITTKGLEYIKDNISLIFFPKKKEWLNIPKEMLIDDSIDINEPFIPSLKVKDLKSFSNYLKKMIRE